MNKPYRQTADEVEVIDFNDESHPLLERTLNYGLSGLSVVPREILKGQRQLSEDERAATLRMAQVLCDMFTVQCEIAFEIADQLPIVTVDSVDLYRKRAHQFVMTAINEILRDVWEQLRLTEDEYLQTATVLQNIMEPFIVHGMLQPHWIQFGEVRQTLEQIQVPRGLFVRTLGQPLTGIDRRQVSTHD